MSREQKYPKRLRFQWYKLVEMKKWSVKDTCDFYSIPRKTYYAWYLRDHGYGANDYRSKRDHPNTKLTRDIRGFIKTTKLKTNYGPHKMKLAVFREFGIKVSHTIIQRYYQKEKLIRKPQKRLPWYEPMKEKLIITGPGTGVQFDVKYVYASSKRQYQFSALDPYTEKHYFLTFKRRFSKNAITLFKAAEEYFGFKILSAQTDNGSEFRGYFHTWLTRKKIPHYFIPKSTPWWSGKVERVHRTIDDEYYHNPYRTWKTVYDWLHYYNYERIHLSLNGLTPHEKYLETVEKCHP